MRHHRAFKFISFIVLVCICTTSYSQSVAQEKMSQLDFLIGEWIGTSKVFDDGKVVKQGAAYESISYDLGKSIVVIELNTEFLQLHTIINYDEEDQTYYYHPFSKRGSGKYPAAYQDGQLVVTRDEKTRFIFRMTSEGGFQEYGEKLVNGEWIKTFEDTFMNTQ